MKLVEFTRDMRPYVTGETRLVPDDVAARLEADGDIKPGAPDFPARSPSPAAPEVPAMRKPQQGGRRDQQRQSYLTK